MIGARARSRGLTPLELAIAISVLGCALAATVPACIRAMHAARTAEAVDDVEQILRSSIQRRNDEAAAPPAVAAAPAPSSSAHKSTAPTPLVSAPLTPASVPRGEAVWDAEGTWEHPTWKAIHFSIDTPHWYAYQLDVDPDPSTALRAVARGDLDGDGVLSTFERDAILDPSAPVGTTTYVAKPGLVTTNDLE